MASIDNVEVIIDTDSNEKPFIPKCLICGRPATKRVLSEHNEPLGHYCTDHADAPLAEAQEEEDAAKGT